MDTELVARLAVLRKYVRSGLSRPCIGLSRVVGDVSFATRMYMLATTMLVVWTLVLIVLIAFTSELRSATMLANLFVMVGVSTLLVAGLFAVVQPGAKRPVAPHGKSATTSAGHESNDFVLAQARKQIGNIANAFRQMTDRRDDLTLTFDYLGEIISALSIGLLVVDEGGRVRTANPAFRTMAGFRTEEGSGDPLIGMQLAMLFEQQTGQDHGPAHVSGKCVETMLKLADGTSLPTMLTSTPLPQSDPAKGTVCTIIDLSERKLAERHVRAGRERVESLVQHLHEIQEMERSRIARDLHDDLGAVLTALRNGLVRLSGQVGTGAVATANDLVELADKANISVDRVIRNLWPQMLDHFGLGGALEVLAAEFEAAHGIATSCSVDTGQTRFDRKVELALYRTSQEALTNIAKHAHARSARVSLRHEGCETVLEISDDGHGFAKRNRQEGEGGYGLLGMRQRIAAVNGELSVKTGVDGSKIIVKVQQTSDESEVPAAKIASTVEG